MFLDKFSLDAFGMIAVDLELCHHQSMMESHKRANIKAITEEETRCLVNQILLGKGRVEVWQSRSPSNKENRGEFQKKARDFVVQARAIYQKAHDQHKASWEAYPKFIDKVEEPKQFEERRQAEVRYIIAQLDLAHCLYEEAQ